MTVRFAPRSGVSVGRLHAQEIGAAIGLLSRAFLADPILTCYFRGARRPLAFRLLFGDLVLAHRALGHVYALRDADRLLAVALWSPPHASAPQPLERLRAALFAGALKALCPRGAAALGAGFRQLSHLRPSEPHWYLAFVGVEPTHQGKGLGAAILAPALALADDQQRLCYLETPFPRTHSFYRRLGFEMTGEHRPFAAAPPIWTFTRQPGSPPELSRLFPGEPLGTSEVPD